MKKKYFLDTEFIEDGKTIDLISIGLVCEDGRKLYIQNSECDFDKASEWVYRNVLSHISHFDFTCRTVSLRGNPELFGPNPWASRSEIRTKVLDFCDVEKYGKPEFWGYYADYDWVVFCQLFGTMMDLPNGFPMYCRDLKQWADQLGDARLPKPTAENHHALEDAEWVKESYDYLTSRSASQFSVKP